MTDNSLTEYPSIAKPWLKYYSEEAINAPSPERTIYEYLLEKNKERLDKIAINYFGNKISFKRLFQEIDKTAAAFSAVGIREGDIVIITSVTTPETIFSFYALNRIGAISNMIDPRTSIDGIRDYILEVDAHTVIVLDLAYERISKAIKGTNVNNIIIISVSDSLPFHLKFFYRLKNKYAASNSLQYNWHDFIMNGNGTNFFETKYSRDSCCTIVHTGGTTGNPKGVMLSNDNINTAAQQILESPLPLSCGDVFLNIMPPFIAYGTVLGIHTVGVGGLTTVIIPKFDPFEFDKLLLKYKPQCIMGVPSHFENIINSKKMQHADLSFLKVAFVGGEKIKEEMEKSIDNFFENHNSQIKISKGYSLTEASATATFASKECNKVGSVGSPLSKTIVSAFGDSIEDEKKYGEIGNIYISSPTIMMGYFGKKEETDRIISIDKNGRKWLYTGDTGYIDTDGCVYITGREKRIIVRYDGFKVFPAAVESVIEKLDEVKECCVVGISDQEHSQGKLPIVFVILKNGISESPMIFSKITELCSKELAEYAQPEKIIFLKTLPVTPIGKVDYRTLEKMAEEEAHVR